MGRWIWWESIFPFCYLPYQIDNIREGILEYFLGTRIRDQILLLQAMEQIIKDRKSLLVPSVQELTKNKIEAIPSRYCRPDHEDLIISEADGLPELPVIDMQSLLSEESELAKLHLACKEWGFFQVFL